MTLACAAALVKKKIYRDLVDFDNHLDDITQVPDKNVNRFYFFFGSGSALNWLSWIPESDPPGSASIEKKLLFTLSVASCIYIGIFKPIN